MVSAWWVHSECDHAFKHLCSTSSVVGLALFQARGFCRASISPVERVQEGAPPGVGSIEGVPRVVHGNNELWSRDTYGLSLVEMYIIMII